MTSPSWRLWNNNDMDEVRSEKKMRSKGLNQRGAINNRNAERFGKKKDRAFSSSETGNFLSDIRR
jgi:hypothetical protein